MTDWEKTRQAQLVRKKYADILPLSRPEPPREYPRMTPGSRAKIFSPFAALRGFEEELSHERGAAQSAQEAADQGADPDSW